MGELRSSSQGFKLLNPFVTQLSTPILCVSLCRGFRKHKLTFCLFDVAQSRKNKEFAPMGELRSSSQGFKLLNPFVTQLSTPILCVSLCRGFRRHKLGSVNYAFQ